MAIKQVKRPDFDRAWVEEEGLSRFVRLAWPQVIAKPYIHGWHIDLLCRELEQFYAGMIRKMVIMVPPGSMKTLLTGVFGPAWAWIKSPSLGFIMTTYGLNLGLKAARQHRALINSQWFRARWPEVSIPYKNTHAAAWFENIRKGFRFSGSTGGEVTGRHGDVLVGDDLNKAQDAMGNAAISLTALDASWEFWSQVLPTRQTDPRTTRRLLIGQRIHERDVPGRWIESDPDVQVVCLPLHYDPDHPYAHQHDPREPGELLWPERMPESEVEDLRRTLGPVHAEAQLEQRPVPVGGGVFKRDWVRFWTRLPERLEVVDSWDMTFGATGQSSSWVVGQKWGRSGADRYLIDQTRGRVEYPAMRDMLRTFSAKKPVASVKLVEDKAAGKPIVQDLRGEIHGLIEVKVTGASGGKLARAQATTGQWEAGNVYLPHPTDAMLPDGTLHPCPWVHDLIERLCTFRGVPGDVADEVDAMSQVLNRWESHGSYVDDWKKALKS